MTSDPDLRAAVLKWIDAYVAITKEKKEAKCPICGKGNLRVEDAPGDKNEVRIFCDLDPTHEVYLLNPDKQNRAH